MKYSYLETSSRSVNTSFIIAASATNQFSKQNEWAHSANNLVPTKINEFVN
jgi:hypothetical protein